MRNGRYVLRLVGAFFAGILSTIMCIRVFGVSSFVEVKEIVPPAEACLLTLAEEEELSRKALKTGDMVAAYRLKDYYFFSRGDSVQADRWREIADRLKATQAQNSKE